MSDKLTNEGGTDLHSVSVFPISFGSLSLLVGGSEYYYSLKKDLESASKSILICGWTFNLSTSLDKNQTTIKDVLFSLPESVEVKILIWDYPLIYTPDRDPFTALAIAFESKTNISFQRFDFHPIMSSLHSKLVVIDSKIAYVGGLDIDLCRLDGPYNLDNDPVRLTSEGENYRPFRDFVFRIKDGVHALEEYFFQLWNSQKNQLSEFSARLSDFAFKQGDLILARTVPSFKGRPKDISSYKVQYELIKNAKDYIYIENQYLSHEGLIHLLCEKLRDKNGPEVIIVVSYGKMPWLEKVSMGVLLLESVKTLVSMDEYDRLGLYALRYRPTLDEDAFVKVHSKCMVVDGKFLKVGSSNFSKRSMEFDYEIDLFLYSDRVKYFENTIFKTLLTPPDVKFVREESLLATFEKYKKKYKRLYPVKNLVDKVPALAQYKDYFPLDKYKMTFFERAGQKIINRKILRKLNTKTILVFIILFVVALLAISLPIEQLEMMIKNYVFDNRLSGTLGLAVVLFSGYLLLGAVFFPLNLYILLCGAFFSPLHGFILSVTGAMSTALLSYFIGIAFESVTFFGKKAQLLDKLKDFLHKRSLATIVFLRMVPLAPYALVNLVCGKFRVPLGRFILGTLIGVSPGAFALIFMEKQLIQVFKAPSFNNIAYLLTTVLVFALAYRMVKKRMSA